MNRRESVDIGEFSNEDIRLEYFERFGKLSALNCINSENDLKEYISNMTIPYFKFFITDLLDLSRIASEEDIVNAFREFIQNRL